MTVVALGLGWCAGAKAYQFSDFNFTVAGGEAYHWERVAPAYGAWKIDQNTPGGPIAFSGAKLGMDGLFEVNECESVGCRVYTLDSPTSTEPKQLFMESDTYGVMDVDLAPSGSVYGVSVQDYPETPLPGRIWSFKNGTLSEQRIAQKLFEVAEKGGNVLAAASGSLTFSLRGNNTWRERLANVTCTFYAIDRNGPNTLISGYAGTFRLSRDGRTATKIGPASDDVWSSKDGKTIVLSTYAEAGDSPLTMSTDGGKTWQVQKIIDGYGKGACENKNNDASECSDTVPGVRLGFETVVGKGSELWAFGGRRDIPGGRVYRYSGDGSWQRVPFPADIWWASDGVLNETGQPLVASLEGIYRAVPGAVDAKPEETPFW